MPAYTDKVQIANRALQHLRRPRITAFTNQSREASTIGATYERLREAELEANLWRFSTRRAALRGITTSTQLWTPPAYAAGTTYAVGHIVTSGGEWWQSKLPSNLAHTPDAGIYWRRYFGPDTLAAWDTDIAYYAGELVSIAGDYFLSLESGNEDATTEPTWLEVNGTVANMNILYPLGCGPADDQRTRNIYRLPHGYLRMAPQDPKGDAYPTLGVPSGPQRDDWVVESGYLVTARQPVMLIRFVADTVDPIEWDALFCEMLAAAHAKELAPDLVADEKLLPVLLSRAEREYKNWRRKAVAANAIEVGPVSRYVDDLITVRL